MPTRIVRAVYAEMFGPTTGDRVRLADLIIEVEKHFTVYGEEVKFGGLPQRVAMFDQRGGRRWYYADALTSSSSSRSSAA